MKLTERVPANNCKQKTADGEFGTILQNNSENLKSSLVFCKPSWMFCLNLTVPSQKCSLFDILVDVYSKFLRSFLLLANVRYSSHCCFFQMCLLTTFRLS